MPCTILFSNQSFQVFFVNGKCPRFYWKWKTETKPPPASFFPKHLGTRLHIGVTSEIPSRHLADIVNFHSLFMWYSWIFTVARSLQSIRIHSVPLPFLMKFSVSYSGPWSIYYQGYAAIKCWCYSSNDFTVWSFFPGIPAGLFQAPSLAGLKKNELTPPLSPALLNPKYPTPLSRQSHPMPHPWHL